MPFLNKLITYLFHYQKVALIVIPILSVSQAVNAQEIDILLKGGHLIDPKNNINAKMDIAILDGKIFRVAANIPESLAKKTINVSGLFVSPGIIDMHVHVFQGTDKYSTSVANSSRSQQADAFSFRSGVTTMVDAGTSGWRNFRTFKAQSIDKSQTRILAFLNVIGNGMIGRFEEQDVNDMNPEMNAYMIKKLFPEILVGIKSAHYWGEFTSVDKAIESGKLADVPIMVDFGEHVPTNSIESLFLKHFRPGDIFTHTYSEISAGRESIVDEKSRKLKPFILEAQKRGVIFDVGHGGGAFSWAQAIPAFKQGFLPDVISSDLHDQSMNAGMKDMTNVMSKFLALGMQLKDVIERSTWAPAKVIKRTDLGHLSVGAEADIAVFNLRDGKFGFTDVRKVSVEGSKKLEAELTLKAGIIMWDLNGISGQAWQD
ncbi:MAG: amidohydrolase/deacetylase family metallohydrolase [Daejeonella sp.]|uniref:amidohydrolase/deacetylase family metallohydrolase n=1 Tax=Daejeonella sp. TaxID=2805397 RepID=UPI002735AB46|nr:amidohydrolase/deacetylase family metallohydrolase [Daejeonella sp.]MDP3469141.1 amidohydrolase/deacetylase family metallohydrolase [Daejeonella sp.]